MPRRGTPPESVATAARRAAQDGSVAKNRSATCPRSRAADDAGLTSCPRGAIQAGWFRGWSHFQTKPPMLPALPHARLELALWNRERAHRNVNHAVGLGDDAQGLRVERNADQPQIGDAG